MLPVTIIIGTILIGSIAFKAVLAKRWHSAVKVRREFIASFNGTSNAIGTTRMYVLTFLYIAGSFVLMASIGFLFFLLNSPLSYAP